ncbi:MAG: DUF6266 family protein [Chitinophagales bacterium]
MGRIKKDIMGIVTGRVGNISGSEWKGKAVIKSRPGPRKKGSSSPEQQKQQARFALMIAFLQPITYLLNLNFDRRAKGMSGFNRAFAYNLVQGITGTFPNFAIDYPKVQLSRGNQSSIGAATCASPEAGKLVFSWTFIGEDSLQSNDLVYVAAYNQEMNHWAYDRGTVQRSKGTIALNLTGLSGKPFHTYIGIISAKNGLTSNSFYSGIVTVV